MQLTGVVCICDFFSELKGGCINVNICLTTLDYVLNPLVYVGNFSLHVEYF